MIVRWFKLRQTRAKLASQAPATRQSGLADVPDLNDELVAEAVVKIAMRDPDADCRRAAGDLLCDKRSSKVLIKLRSCLLTSMQIDERMRAAQLLSRIGGPEAIAALARGVEDFTFRRMQEDCMRALAATRDPAVIPLLGKFADDSFWYPSRKRRVGGSGIDIGRDEGVVAREDARLRAEALECLAQIGGEEVLAILRRHLKAYDITVRSTAERALRAAGAAG